MVVKKAMGRFRIHLPSSDNTWSIRYIIYKDKKYRNSSLQWTLVSLNFNTENYGIKLIYNHIDTSQADMCFSSTLVSHFVY